MATGNGLEGLIGFIGRDEVWRERLADVLDEHLMPAMEDFEVDFEDIGEERRTPAGLERKRAELVLH